MESQCALWWVLIPERFDDEGHSGATLGSRRGTKVCRYYRCLARVSRGLVDQVIVHRLDRLSRSPRGWVKLLHEFRQMDVALVVVTAPELGYSAQDSFMLNILASFAEFEREMSDRYVNHTPGAGGAYSGAGSGGGV
jgi:site-specific DNA recombinase